MKKIVFVMAMISGLFIAQGADAQPRTSNINRTQYNQHQRIQHGVRNGELTRHEVLQLKKQQAHIKHDKRMAKADGRITPNERRHIAREQKCASRSIYKAKHNGRYRG